MVKNIMIKRFVVFLIIITGSLSLQAQKKKQPVKKNTPTSTSKEHKVAPKESFYSIAKIYRITPKELADFNKISLDKGLQPGQKLKIPSAKNTNTKTEPVAPKSNTSKPAPTPTPLSASAPQQNTVSAEAGAPIYHTVAAGETLYRLSQQYNKVPIDQIKKWNNLTTNNVSIGSRLIVGYGEGITQIAEEERDTLPIIDEGEANRKNNTEQQGALSQNKGNATENKNSIENSSTQNEIAIAKPQINFNEGFFKDDYLSVKNRREDSHTGTSGVFKSTSGWEDGQYYCVFNGANSGSIIKITDVASGKSIYAKVLDAIPDIKQNAGLLVLISNAAAEELGVGDRFDCVVTVKK